MSLLPSPARAFSFIELLIALVILGIIGVVAANAIVTATDVGRTAVAPSRAAAQCREAARLLAADVANMACGPVLERKAFAQIADEETSELAYEIVVVPPEAERPTAKGLPTLALVVRYVARENEDRTWRLERGVARLGINGELDEFSTGVVVDRCRSIAFDPVVEGSGDKARLKKIGATFVYTFDPTRGEERVAVSAASPIEPPKEDSGGAP